MNNSKNLSKTIVRLLKKSSLSLFIIAIAGSLVYAIFILTNIIQKTPDYNKADDSNYSIMIDSQITSELEKIKNANDNSDYNNLPNTRLNPFAE